jgi:hypothetical protein
MTAKSKKILDGKPATQINVTIDDDMLQQIKEAGKLDFMKFSGYVRSLIANDLKQAPQHD